MILIPLTQGKFAKIDDEDFDKISQYKFCYNSGYAVSRRNKKRVSMHRLVMGFPVDREVDHIDHDTLNNQKSNLRICTTAQNQGNSKKRKNCTSKFKGVYAYVANGGRQKYYVAVLKFKDKMRTKFFPFTPEGELRAAVAYNEMAIERHGEFAALNKVETLATV